MSNRFAVDWLMLREPADHAARAARLLERLQAWCAPQSELQIADLGAGTGSNLRFLAPRLSSRQHWTLIDHDPALLARADSTGPSVGLRTHCASLTHWRRDLSAPPQLVTASALLDLVSVDWLDTVVADCRADGAGAYFALSYDGQVTWSAPDPDDAEVLARVNAHQQRDKGLGAALGPRATATLAQRFRAAGHAVWVAPSPWDLGPANAELAEALIAGWVAAAGEQSPEDAANLVAWGQRRCVAVRAGRTRIRVGHQDLLALPADPE